MRLKVGAAVVAAACVAALSQSAYAGIEFLGLESGGSWFGNWSLDTSAFSGVTFDRLEITINNGQAHVFFLPGPTIVPANTTDQVFESPYTANIGNFSDGSWSQNGTGTSTFVSATGNAQNFLAFRLHLGPGNNVSGDDSGPRGGVAWDLQAYSGSTLIGVGSAVFQKISATQTTNYTDFHLVPTPTALWSGLAMMLGFGGFLVKRRRDRVVLS
jgi:LPXTG-motif cell wall-anchored protein